MDELVRLSTQIRTNVGGVVTGRTSSERLHNNLINLFVDRTAIDTSLRRFMSNDALMKVMIYNDCFNLNDEIQIAFNKNFPQINDDIKESNNMFIARSSKE